MKRSELLVHPERRPFRRRLRPLWLTLGLVVAVAALVAGGSRAFVDVHTVARVTIVNETVYTAEVDVADAQRSGWLRLGTADRGTTTSVVDVVDQGDVWIFRFESQGLEGGEQRYEKSELVRSGWRVVVSESVAARLGELGAAPSPLSPRE